MNPKFKEIDLVNIKLQFWNSLISKVDDEIISKVIHQVMDPIWVKVNFQKFVDKH